MYKMYVKLSDLTELLKRVPTLNKEPVVSTSLSSLVESSGAVLESSETAPPGYVPVKYHVTAMFSDGFVIIPKYLNSEVAVNPPVKGSIFYKTYDQIEGLNGKPTAFDFQLLCCAEFLNRIAVNPLTLRRFIPYTQIKPLGASFTSHKIVEVFTYIYVDSPLRHNLNFIKDCDCIVLSCFPKHPIGTVGEQFLKLLALE